LIMTIVQGRDLEQVYDTGFRTLDAPSGGDSETNQAFEGVTPEQMRSYIAALREANQGLADMILGLREQLRAAGASVPELDDVTARRVLDVAGVGLDIIINNAKGARQERDDLLNERAHLNRLLDEAHKQLEALRQGNSELTTENSRLTEENDRLAAEVAALKASIGEERNRNLALTAGIRALQQPARAESQQSGFTPTHFPKLD
jgi:chromosome segregation ATPase